MNLDKVFQQVMEKARASFEGTSSEFDYSLSVDGYCGGSFSGDHSSAAQSIDNALFGLANGALREQLTEPGDPSDDTPIDLETTPMDQRPHVIRKRRLRGLLASRLDRQVTEARNAKYTGWSQGSSGPIRRVR